MTNVAFTGPTFAGNIIYNAQRKVSVFKAELATESDRGFGLGGRFGPSGPLFRRPGGLLSARP